MRLALTCLDPRPMAHLRLICIAHAGSGPAAFRPWVSLLPSEIEPYGLLLPGREDALADTPFAKWADLAAELQALLPMIPQGKIALYGHSLGAVIALDLARLLAPARGDRLAHLFCAARPWPGTTPALPDPTGLSDEALLELMANTFGDVGAGMDNEDIRALFLPVLRADLSLLRSYTYKPAEPLPCPLTVYAGSEDPISTDTDYSLWNKETTGIFKIETLQAGHLFHQSAKETLVADLTEKSLKR